MYILCCCKGGWAVCDAQVPDIRKAALFRCLRSFFCPLILRYIPTEYIALLSLANSFCRGLVSENNYSNQGIATEQANARAARASFVISSLVKFALSYCILLGLTVLFHSPIQT